MLKVQEQSYHSSKSFRGERVSECHMRKELGGTVIAGVIGSPLRLQEKAPGDA